MFVYEFTSLITGEVVHVERRAGDLTFSQIGKIIAKLEEKYGEGNIVWEEVSISEKKEGVKMDLKELEKLMVEHGLVIRAIPYEKTSVFEIRHKKDYPNAVVFYSAARKCEMIRVTEKNQQGGKFIIAQKSDQGRVMAGFEWGKPTIFYDTIEQAVKSFIDDVKSK
jgi:hypothetical protein